MLHKSTRLDEASVFSIDTIRASLPLLYLSYYQNLLVMSGDLRWGFEGPPSILAPELSKTAEYIILKQIVASDSDAYLCMGRIESFPVKW